MAKFLIYVYCNLVKTFSLIYGGDTKKKKIFLDFEPMNLIIFSLFVSLMWLIVINEILKC